MKNKTIVFVEKGITEIQEKEMPICQHDTILLKTIFSGMTNGTERNVLMGGNYNNTGFPCSLGYQNVSCVVECGADITKFKMDDVVFTGTFSGHTEYHLAKEDDLSLIVSEGYDLQEAALFGVASVPFHDARRASVNPFDKVAVFGAGLIGQFAAQAARISGAHVTVVDIDEKRLSLAKELGADDIINIGYEKDKQKLFEKRPFNVIFECSGANVLPQIIGTYWGNGLIGFRGRILMIAGRESVEYNFNSAQATELAIMHAGHFDKEDLQEVGRLYQKGAIKIRPLINEIVPINDAVKYYDKLRDTPNELLGIVFEW